MSQRRIDKTLDKIRGGGLPLCSGERGAIESDNGQRSNGCGDLIAQVVRIDVVVPGIALLPLHDDCYDAWSTIGS